MRVTVKFMQNQDYRFYGKEPSANMDPRRPWVA